MTADGWALMHDGLSYKVFKARPRLRSVFPFTVTRPDGSILTVATTRWGARWAIRRDITRKPQRKWWDGPIVDEVKP